MPMRHATAVSGHWGWELTGRVLAWCFAFSRSINPRGGRRDRTILQTIVSGIPLVLGLQVQLAGPSAMDICTGTNLDSSDSSIPAAPLQSSQF